MEVTVDFAFMFIVGILCTKDRGTDRTSKMLNVILAVESGNIRAAQGPAAFVAEEIEPTEIINLAQRVLSTAIFRVDREKLGCHDLAAVLRRRRVSRGHPLSTCQTAVVTYLALETLQVVCGQQRSHKLTG